ncbi:hypothetical protein TIFTF001_003036 [Ficus carica]|uniref:Ankyrin repeat protein n=1 Tax=Ficus carica TaxID=3494 RepID=A0AA87ZQ59_FICCA|nr:hypothetical protein TIFTF001_003036 [Ficus carica]
MEEKLNKISHEGDIDALYQFISEHTKHVFDDIGEKPLVDSPLYMAAASDIDKELGRVQGKGGRTSLHYVAEYENLHDFLDAFLSACPASLEDVTNRRQTALHLASKKGKFKSVEIMLKWCNKGLRSTERRKFLNLMDEDGNTHGHNKKSKPESGIGVNAINVEGLTALDISKQRDVGNREEIKEMLTRAGELNAVSVSERLYSSEHYLR